MRDVDERAELKGARAYFRRKFLCVNCRCRRRHAAATPDVTVHFGGIAARISLQTIKLTPDVLRYRTVEGVVIVYGDLYCLLIRN